MPVHARPSVPISKDRERPLPYRPEAVGGELGWSAALGLGAQGGIQNSRAYVRHREEWRQSDEGCIGQVSVADLNRAASVLSPEQTRVTHLLADAVGHIQDALSAYDIEDPIAADDAIQRMHVLLPALFCCRSMGDGFRAVINAIICSLENLSGQPLTRDQMAALKLALNRIQQEPALPFSTAVEETIKLEEVGFTVEPAEMEYLLDWLDE